ncbi:type II secretion system F family protein [Mucisphaera calidilacus]|uniref:Type II secretion system protein F n=1 Tax=Mucisphaera calidilacus TaxID=2527982 RepID=A0A518BTA9_9BACT|nr:type II secretion system F family protein [Mucisphaera calidilacus]QDU70207.1 Putative type II secretion system protein F [Mucisphaera calidilacus]
MPDFTFKARTSAGQIDTGILDADSLAQAAARLRQRGLFPVSINPARDGQRRQNTKPTRPQGSVKRADVIAFANELAILLDAGVIMRDALACATGQARNDAMGAVLKDIQDHVQSGGTLSDALAQRPDVFPTLMVSMISASEASGTLSDMLMRVADYMEQEQKIQRTVRSAMTYPLVMFVATFTITAFLIGFVLPRFASIYASRGADLPLPTQLLIGISTTFTSYWPHMLAGAIALGIGAYFYFRSTHGRHLIDTAKLGLPLFGPLFNKLYLTRSFRTMSVMLDAGVPLLDLIGITRNITTNHHIARLWDDVADQVKQGGNISTVLRDSPYISGSIAQMIASGEQAGRVGDIMARVAQRTEEEFERGVKAMTQFVEPAMIAALGLVVGFVAIALLLPIFSVGKVVSGG